MNYAELVAHLYTSMETDENGISSTDMAVLVRSAEDLIYQSVELPSPQVTVAGSVTSGNRFLSTPTDFLAPNTLVIIDNGSYYPLLPKETSFIREAYPTVSETGRPRYYSVHDHNTLMLAPTPDQNYSAEFNYFSKPESVVDAGTNFLSTTLEGLLIAACQLKVYLFQKGETELFAQYEKAFGAALTNYANIGEVKLRTDKYRRNPSAG